MKTKPKSYLQSIYNQELKFEILAFDAETGVAKLKGRYAAVFEEALSKDRMDKVGYKIVTEKINADQMAPPE